ncbi:MAG: type II secretion system F family protein [Trueperella sp.]|uniref:type II secretion system F family protein n=1 Tax=Trueperella sp. TaxID=2699835 RepID=UPI0025E3D054|nr:type II secretion system F family protein [Trueperella sp.]MCI7305443.1 type II secretion system F family protein [Trueperella sp.]MDY5403538.1 type II secretion system F family protein [Trueperella sp.]
MLVLVVVAAVLAAVWVPWRVPGRVSPGPVGLGAVRPGPVGWVRDRLAGLVGGGGVVGRGAVDTAVVLDLAAAALSSGLSIPGTLKALDVAIGGAARTQTANLLLMGATWEEAWEELPRDRLREALRAAWTDGAAPVPLIQRSAQSLRLQRQRNAKEAAARLGARLVLPLGLCFLPAFILLGIVPVVAGAAGRLLGM